MRIKRQFLADPVWLIACCFLFSTGVVAQTIVRSFNGDSGPGLAVCQTGITHCNIPELNVGASGKQVAQITWQNVNIYDYRGHLLKSTPLATLIRDAGLNPIQKKATGPYETHIVYDEFIHRWLITAMGLDDVTLVSASADAQGAWGGVYVSCLQGGPCLDYDDAMHIGYDKNGVYECSVHQGDETPNTIPHIAYDCFAIPPKEVIGIAKGIAPSHINRAHHMPLDDMPAIDHNKSKAADAPAFFVAKSCDRTKLGGCQNSNNFQFHWLVDTFTWKGLTGTYSPDGEQVVKTGIGSTEDKWFYSKPCCALGGMPQAGSPVLLRATESHRLTNLVQFGSHLQFTLGSGPCTQSCGSQGIDTNNVVFWADLDCSKTTACMVSQTAKISGDFNPEFATVGIDDKGNTGIIADSVTPNTDLSVLLWTHKTTDEPNTFKGPTVVIAGTKPFTCLDTHNVAVIGNAAGILTSLDPKDGTKLWTTEQWSGDATPCVWDTRIVEYQMAPPHAKPTGSVSH